MSQLYRQMEEEVAQRVRETMQLANSRRKTLAPADDKVRQTVEAPRGPLRKARTDRWQEFELGDGSMDSSVRVIESIASEESENDFSVLKTGKDATAKRMFLANNVRNVANDTIENIAKRSNDHQYHIGFERVQDNVDKKPGSITEQTTDAGVASSLSENERELALGALTLAQTAASNMDNRLCTLDGADKRQLAQGALNLAQGAAGNIANSHHETNDTDQSSHLAAVSISDADKRNLAEGALMLAQSAAWNIDNKAHDEADKRPQGEPNVAITEGALSLAQNATNISNQTGKLEGELNLALAEGMINLEKSTARNIAHRLKAEDRRGLAEEALSLAQNAAWSIDNRVYETEVEKRRIAEGALQLAQHAVSNLDGARTSIVDRRELAELAIKNMEKRPEGISSATNRELSKEVRSLEGDSFESMTGPENQQSQKLQLGFDHLAASYDQIRNDKELGEVINEINKRSLAEHDKKTILAAEAKLRQLSKDLQNLEMDIDNNNYDMKEVDESNKELAEGALSLAQMGARHMGTSDTKIRELGEGALSLAQTAARERSSKEAAETCLEDAFFNKLTSQHKQILPLGFEQIENSSDGEFQETKQAEPPHHSHGSKRRALDKDPGGSKTNK